MSKPKPEMVTIEVPVTWEERWIIDSHSPSPSLYTRCVTNSCKQALAARKTKLERFKEYIGAPWEFRPFGYTNGMVYFRGDENPQTNTRDCHPTPRQAKLMAAAPQLLEALIGVSNNQKHLAHMSHSEILAIEDAIRAALPDDVADEVLGQ